MSEGRFAYLGEIILKRPLLVAAIAALAAVLFASAYLSERETELLRISEPQNAVVAARDITAGEMVDEGSVIISKIPQRFCEPGLMNEISAAGGRIAAVSIQKDSQITAANTRSVSEMKNISALIPAGRRAVSVALDDAQAIAGLLKPNDLVDVIATFDLGSEASVKRSTLAIAENVQVLAVGRDIANSIQMNENKSAKGSIFGGGAAFPTASRSQTVVTLAAEPASAQKILFSANSGSVSLALRPFGDDGTIENTEPTTISTITGGHDETLPFKKGYREYRGK